MRRGGLSLDIKKAKPNTAGPTSIFGPKTQEEEVGLRKSEKKSKNKNEDDQLETLTKQTASAINSDRHAQSSSTLDTPNKNVQSSSTPKNKEKANLKKVDSATRPEDNLDTFKNRNLAQAERENLAAQCLEREVQKVADELRGQNQPAAERDEKLFEDRQKARSQNARSQRN